MSMYYDIVWVKKRRIVYCEFPSRKKSMREDSRTDIGRFLDLYLIKQKGTELIRTNRMENGIDSLRT